LNLREEKKCPLINAEKERRLKKIFFENPISVILNQRDKPKKNGQPKSPAFSTNQK